MLVVDAKACTGCKLCEKNCPFSAMMVVDGTARALDNCTLCGACMNVCSVNAISIERAAASPEELAAYQGVAVWAECEETENGSSLAPKRVALELLGIGRELADRLGQPLIALVAGDERPIDVDALIAHGADRVIRHQNKLLWPYSTDAYATVISAMVAARKPNIFLLGATTNGRDLAPRVAARLKLGLTADCTRLEINADGQLVQTRPAFGGNIMASILTPFSRPQMATVRPKVFPVPDAKVGRSGALEDFDVALRPGVVRTRLLGVEVMAGNDGGGIDEANILVSAGLGLGSAANLKPARELAELLGGRLAGSRAIVEAGWIPHTLQVGQSGTTVSPDLYIALGISGAVQHIVGMSSAKTVIAVNSDPEAPIFKVADIGIVGDAMQVLPALIREAKAALSPRGV